MPSAEGTGGARKRDETPPPAKREETNGDTKKSQEAPKADKSKQGGVKGVVGVLVYVFTLFTVISVVLWMVNIGPYKMDEAAKFLVDIGPLKMYPAPKLGLLGSLFVDVSLAAFFFVPHSIFCRPAIKKRLGDGPDSLYRSMYVLQSDIAVQMIIHYWQPVWKHIVLWDFWSVSHYSIVVYILAFAWWFSAFMVIDHFEFLGIKQTTGIDVMAVLGIAPVAGTSAAFYGQPRLHYKLCRHPVQFGFLCLFFLVPKMTFNHLFFSATCALYIYVCMAYLLEPELVQEFPGYKKYQEEMPMFCPVGQLFRGSSAKKD